MRLRYVLIGAAVALAVVLVAGAVIVARTDLAPYVARVEAAVKEATGRELKIRGPVGFRLSLFPTVAAENVTFQNARWGSRPLMAEARRVEIQVALLPLLAGDVVIRRLELVDPDVLLEVNANGEKNWSFAKSAAATEAKTPPRGAAAVAVRQVRVTRGVLVYRQAWPKLEHRARIDDLRVDASSGYDTIEVDGEGQLNGVALAVSGSLGNLGRAGTAGAVGDFELDARAGGNTLRASGAAPLSGAGLAGLDAEVSASIPDAAALRALLRASVPRLPPTELTARARVTRQALEVEDLEVSAGKSRAKGRLEMALTGERRPIRARLDAPLVDLQELYAGGGKPAAAAPSAGGGRVFPDDPLPVAALKALEGEADLHVEKLRLADGRTLEGVGARLSFERGRIRGEDIGLRVDGRELRLELAADASSGRDLAVNAALTGEKVPLAALTGLLGVTAAPQGAPTDVAVTLAGRGASVRALMASANGDVRVAVGPGRIRNRTLDLGADVTELLNSLNPARARDDYTDLKCAVLRFPVRNGIATIDNGIAVETGKVRVIGGGTVNLRTEQLDLGFRPAASSGLGVGAGALARFARVSGPLADPRIGLDAQSAAAGAAAAGVALLTGGLTLLAGGLLLDDVPENACQVALAGAPKARPKQESGGGFFDPIRKLFGN